MVEKATSRDMSCVGRGPGILPGPRSDLTMGFNMPDAGVEDEEWASTPQRKEFLDLFTTHYNRVNRYIARRIEIAEAEDLASDVFIRGAKAIDNYKDTGAPMEAWLFKIARNSIIDYLRERNRRLPPLELNTTVRTPLRLIADPFDKVEYDEEIEALHHAMEKLTDAQRQVLALRFGAEMTSKEVGQVVGRSDGAVREMQSVAISKLRTTLSGDDTVDQYALIKKERPVAYEDIAAFTKMSLTTVVRSIERAEQTGSLMITTSAEGKHRRMFSGEGLKKVLELLQTMKDQRVKKTLMKKEAKENKEKMEKQKRLKLEAHINEYMGDRKTFKLADIPKATGRSSLTKLQRQQAMEIISYDQGDGITLTQVIQRETFFKICQELGLVNPYISMV